MGSSGMKRKGRKHLPKVGTRPAIEHELHDRREEALHPFSGDPLRRRSGDSGVLAIAIGVVVVLAVLAVLIATS